MTRRRLALAQQHPVECRGATYCVVLDVSVQGGALLPQVPIGARRRSRWQALRDLQAIRAQLPSTRLARLPDEPQGARRRTQAADPRIPQERRHDERSRAPSNR